VNKAELIAKHPTLFLAHWIDEGPGVMLDIPEVYVDLIDALVESTREDEWVKNPENKEHGVDVISTYMRGLKLTQIKTKFSRLCVYFVTTEDAKPGDRERFEGAIDMACVLAGKMCTECGKEGKGVKLTDGRYDKLCIPCEVEANAALAKR